MTNKDLLTNNIVSFLSEHGFEVDSRTYQDIDFIESKRVLEGNSELSVIIQKAGLDFKVDIDFYFHNLINHNIINSLWFDSFDDFKKTFLNISIIKKLIV